MFVERIYEFDTFICDTCRQYVYDENVGDLSLGIKAKTLVDQLPSTFRCPICLAARDKFRCCTLLDDYFPDRVADQTELGEKPVAKKHMSEIGR